MPTDSTLLAEIHTLGDALALAHEGLVMLTAETPDATEFLTTDNSLYATAELRLYRASGVVGGYLIIIQRYAGNAPPDVTVHHFREVERDAHLGLGTPEWRAAIDRLNSVATSFHHSS